MLAPRIHRPCAVGAISTGRARQHADGVSVAHPGGNQAARDAARPLVHLTPAVPNRPVRFARHHPMWAGQGVLVHRVRKAAHASPPSRDPLREWYGPKSEIARVRKLAVAYCDRAATTSRAPILPRVPPPCNTGNRRNEVERISTPHGPSNPLFRSNVIRPARSKHPSPQRSRRSTVSSNNVPTTPGAASLSSTPKMWLGARTSSTSDSGVFARNTCHASMTSPAAGVASGLDDVDAHRDGCYRRERHRLDGDPCSVFDRLVGEAAQRCDECVWVVDRRPVLRADLDECG